jgi:hypothetical protein
MFTNTIACDLFLDRGKPEFSNWYDPYTRKEAVFGDDKVNETYNYYDQGCIPPYIYCKDSDGNYCDQYGVAWPSYEPKYSARYGGKVVIDWESLQKKIRKAYPNARWIEVQYSTDAGFKNAKTKKIWISCLKKKTVIRWLKKNRNYYFRVRLSSGRKALTNWTRAIEIKTK